MAFVLMSMPRYDIAKLATVGVAGIALMGVLIVLEAAGALPDAFNLDAEYTVPAFYSGLLLVVAGLIVFRLAGTSVGVERLILVLAACFMVFLAFDEVFSVHERIDSYTGIDWQIIYFAPGVAFVWAIWRITGQLGRRGPEARLIVLGLAAWVVAQLLEAAAYSEVTPSLIDTDRMTTQEIQDILHSLPYYALAIPEELLEMVGSLLLAVAFARAVDGRTLARQAADRASRSTV